MERSTQLLQQYCCLLAPQCTIDRLLLWDRATCILPFPCQLNRFIMELSWRKYLELVVELLVRLTTLALGTLGFGLPLYIFFCYLGVTMVLPILSVSVKTTLIIKTSQITDRGSTILSFPRANRYGLRGKLRPLLCLKSLLRDNMKIFIVLKLDSNGCHDVDI